MKKYTQILAVIMLSLFCVNMDAADNVRQDLEDKTLSDVIDVIVKELPHLGDIKNKEDLKAFLREEPENADEELYLTEDQINVILNDSRVKKILASKDLPASPEEEEDTEFPVDSASLDLLKDALNFAEKLDNLVNLVSF